MSASSQDEFLTVAGVADLLRINQQTVRNWIDRRELSAVRVGAGRVRVRRADLDAFPAASAIAPAEPAQQEPKAAGADRGHDDLRDALEHARDTLDSDDDAELAAALREVAGAADRLAQVLSNGSRQTYQPD